MKPITRLVLNRETLQQLSDRETDGVDGAAKLTLVSCRIVSCVFACPTQTPTHCTL